MDEDRRLWPAVLLFVGLLAPCDMLHAQQPQAPEVEAVRFVGARSLPAEELRRGLATRATRCRSPLFALFCRLGADWAQDRRFLPDSAQLRQDVTRLELLYEAWGHPGTTVTHGVVPRGRDVIVEFTINETPPLLVESIVVRGLDTIRPTIALDALPVATGEPYALPRLEATERYVQAVLAEHGRPHATVSFGGDVDEARRRAEVIIDVAPGPIVPFGAPNITASAPLNERVVRERLQFETGEPYRSSALERTERALYQLPIVARAVASAVTVRGQPTVTPEIIVETRRRQAIDVEGTVSSTDCLEIGTFWRDRYFASGPRVLALGVSFSNLLAAETSGSFPCTSAGEDEYGRPNYRLFAELWQPTFGASGVNLKLSAFVHRESAPAVYVQEGFGGELAVSRELRRGLDVQLGVAPERNALDAVALYYCANYGLCAAEEVARFQDASWLVPLQLTGVWRTAGADIFDRPPGGPLAFASPRPPRWRFTSRLLAESAGRWSGSDHTFTRGIVEATARRIITRDLELALRVRGGAVSGDATLPPQLRMFSGGPNTVRGTEQNLVGPQVLVLKDRDTSFTCAPACELGTIDTDQVTIRPAGGDRVIEANIETRLWLSNRMQVAAFLDYGSLARRTASSAVGARSESLLSPGIGVRVLTDLGPIRLDIGYDGRSARTYPIFTRTTDDGVVRIGTARLDPFSWDDASGLKPFARRLQLHFAIGQAF